MKIFTKIIALLSLMLLCSGVFAQKCNLQITDANNGGYQSYAYVVALFDFNVSTTIPIEVQSGTQQWPSSGSIITIYFNTNFTPDKTNLYFRAYARNTSNNRSDQEWSNVFDSAEYYAGILIKLNIP